MQILRQHPEYQQVMKVCNTLSLNGYTAWLAGGCVRDGLLGRLPKDFDVVTNANPDQIEALFTKTVAVGKQFGIIVVIEGEAQIEVATFRSDGHYVDGRHPATVTFAGPEEDAARRDFTINAMFLDPLTNQIYDFVGGEKDLQNRLIRTVGKAQKRFEEDHLRILRAVRFVADLGFNIESETLNEIKRVYKTVNSVSKERQRDELVKFLQSEHIELGLDVMLDVGFIEFFLILTKTQASSIVTVFKKVFHNINSELARLCLFFGLDGGVTEFSYEQAHTSNAAKRIEMFMTDFKFSNLEKQIAGSLMKALTILEAPSRKAKILRLACEPWAMDLDVLVSSMSSAGFKQPQYFYDFESAYKGNYQLPLRFISGEDLKSIGIKPSPQFGLLLEEVYDLQIEGAIKSKQEAMSWCLNLKTHH